MPADTRDFDDFDTKVQSDELIPEGYEDRELEELEEDGDWEPESADPEFVRWEWSHREDD